MIKHKGIDINTNETNIDSTCFDTKNTNIKIHVNKDLLKYTWTCNECFHVFNHIYIDSCNWFCEDCFSVHGSDESIVPDHLKGQWVGPQINIPNIFSQWGPSNLTSSGISSTIKDPDIPAPSPKELVSWHPMGDSKIVPQACKCGGAMVNYVGFTEHYKFCVKCDSKYHNETGGKI